MKALKMKDDIYWIGANISTNDLFEGIWPIPHGVTINSYIVKGEKLAIIDLVRDWGGAPSLLLDELKSLGLDMKDVDYFILNHIEPDHTGDLKTLHKLTENAKIITTEKGKPLVEQFYEMDDDIIDTVSTGDSLDLGGGKKLTFYEIPNVHWPETMATYEESTKTLFPCDAFGSFGALKGSIFDDENNKENHEFFERESLRYYANIVGPFSNSVLKAIEALGPLDIDCICPSHGLVWRGNPGEIVKRYKAYANYMNDYAEPKITVIWGSMYGNTETMLRAVLRGIAKEGINTEIHRIPETDPSYVLASAWESAGIVFGFPTYEYKMYPPASNIIDLFSQKHVWHKKVFRFGSYGWSGGAQRDFDKKTERLKWDFVEPYEFQGAPSAEDLSLGEDKGQEIAKMVKKIEPKLMKLE